MSSTFWVFSGEELAESTPSCSPLDRRNGESRWSRVFHVSHFGGLEHHL